MGKMGPYDGTAQAGPSKKNKRKIAGLIASRPIF